MKKPSILLLELLYKQLFNEHKHYLTLDYGEADSYQDMNKQFVISSAIDELNRYGFISGIIYNRKNFRFKLTDLGKRFVSQLLLPKTVQQKPAFFGLLGKKSVKVSKFLGTAPIPVSTVKDFLTMNQLNHLPVHTHNMVSTYTLSDTVLDILRSIDINKLKFQTHTKKFVVSYADYPINYVKLFKLTDKAKITKSINYNHHIIYVSLTKFGKELADWLAKAKTGKIITFEQICMFAKHCHADTDKKLLLKLCKMYHDDDVDGKILTAQ